MLLISGALLAGDVNVTVKDQTGTKCIAKAVFCYVDDMWEMVVQLVEDREKQAVFFAKLSQGYGLLACICNNTQVQGPWNQQHQGIIKGRLFSFWFMLIKEHKINTYIHES